MPCPVCPKTYERKHSWIGHIETHRRTPWAWAASKALAEHNVELNVLFSRVRALQGPSALRLTRPQTSGLAVSPQSILDAPLDRGEMVNPAGVYGSAARLQMLTLSVLVAQIAIICQLLKYMCEAMRARHPGLPPVPTPSDTSRQLVERYEELVSNRIHFRLQDQALTGQVAVPTQDGASNAAQPAAAESRPSSTRAL